MAGGRIDLAAVEASLRALQAEFPRINEFLKSRATGWTTR